MSTPSDIPTYNDLARLYEKEHSSAFIFAKVPQNYDALNLDTRSDQNAEKEHLNKVVLRAPNARLWAGVAVATGMSLVPVSVISPAAAALTQGVMMVGLAVMFSARNNFGQTLNAVQQQYITAYASIKDKVRNTQLQEKYTAIKAKRDRRLKYSGILTAGSLVSTALSNTESTGSSVLMTAGLCVVSLALLDHLRLKWTSGKSQDMVENIAKRRGELVDSVAKERKAPSM